MRQLGSKELEDQENNMLLSILHTQIEVPISNKYGYFRAQYNRSKVAGHCVRSETKMSDPCVQMSVH